MTPGDWIELLTGSQSNTMAAFTLLLTMLSGYSVIAYVVGVKLPRSQLAIATTLYFVGSLATLVGMRTSMREAARARYHLSNLLKEFDSTTNLEQMFRIVDLILAVDFVLVLAPLIFMWQIRHPKSR